MTRVPEGTIPAPPDGYARPYRLAHSWVLLFVVGTVLGIVALFVALSLSPLFQSGRSVGPVEPGSLLLVFLAGIAGTVVLHELIHGLVYRYYGYEVSFAADPLRGTFTTAARGQLHTRTEAIWIALAPLLGLTPVALVFVAIPVQDLSLIGVLMFVINTSGSIVDLDLVRRLRSVPEGTLLCDGDATYVYEPLESGQRLRAQR